MKQVKNFYNSFLLTVNTYLVLAGISVLFIISFWLPVLYTLAMAAVFLISVLVVIDTVILYAVKQAVTGWREVPERLSNGDENEITLHVQNHYTIAVRCEIIDELPFQFQQRNWVKHVLLKGGQELLLRYTLKPLQRGEYNFGLINAAVRSPLGLVQRRFRCAAEQTVPCYPSYQQLKRYHLIAATSHANEAGNRRLRKLGNSMEFEQIKDYVLGDDYRNINWKATARRGDLMVNTFTDEKSQHIYCVIDKGRNMKMPFEGMTLLDYAINATLVLSNVALMRQDRIGLLTFANKPETFLVADKKGVQMELLLENLYRQQTHFTESDFEALYAQVRGRVRNRSLLILFTNFESVHSFQRQLPYLKQMAKHHLLLVIFFENTELKALRENVANDTEEIYIKTIADRFAFEKRLIVKELQQHGILSVLTTPQHITVNTINKYIELKARQAI